MLFILLYTRKLAEVMKKFAVTFIPSYSYMLWCSLTCKRKDNNLGRGLDTIAPAMPIHNLIRCFPHCRFNRIPCRMSPILLLCSSHGAETLIKLFPILRYINLKDIKVQDAFMGTINETRHLKAY